VLYAKLQSASSDNVELRR